METQAKIEATEESKGRRSISAQITPAVYWAGKRSGIKWGYLVEMGLECIGLRHERNKLTQKIEQLQKANIVLQGEIFKLNEELDLKKAAGSP